MMDDKTIELIVLALANEQMSKLYSLIEGEIVKNKDFKKKIVDAFGEVVVQHIKERPYTVEEMVRQYVTNEVSSLLATGLGSKIDMMVREALETKLDEIKNQAVSITVDKLSKTILKDLNVIKK